MFMLLPLFQWQGCQSGLKTGCAVDSGLKSEDVVGPGLKTGGVATLKPPGLTPMANGKL